MLSLFRKKKNTVSLNLKAADAIEEILVSGIYLNTSGRGTCVLGNRFMCICLQELNGFGKYDMKSIRQITDIIMGRLKTHKTLHSFLQKNGVDLYSMCSFERRIILYNFWWRFIRELRGQPQLGESNV